MSQIPIDQLMQTARDHWAARHPERAEPVLAEVIRRAPETAEAHYMMGMWHLRKSRVAHAEGAFRAVLLIKPDDVASLNNLGAILAKTGRAKEAEQVFGRAAALRPNDPLAQLNLANSCTLAQNQDGAIEAYRRCLELRPDIAEAQVNLGIALRAAGRLEEALPHYQKAADLNRQDFDAQIKYGTALREMGRYEEAMTAYQRALDQRPDQAEAHWNIGMLMLMQGQFAEGWQRYEWRRTVKNSGWDRMISRHHKLKPTRWIGGEAAGRLIYLYAEQAYGEAIQFARYVAMVAERGAKIILAVPSELVPLMGDLPGVVQCVSDETPISRIDEHCPLASLPLIFKTTLETIPASVPYLRAEAGKISAWERRLGESGGRRKIGVAWAHPARSMPLGPLAGAANVRWISLQKKDATFEAPAPPQEMRMERFEAEMTNLPETAALIAQLDLVITMDTVIAHLAGAMGKPVWTVLPEFAHWTWMRGRDDSPWYPTMRLFRQEKGGDWEGLARRVAEALAGT
jgi:tetratricopeptide (TPR) repeat protein